MPSTLRIPQILFAFTVRVRFIRGNVAVANLKWWVCKNLVAVP